MVSFFINKMPVVVAEIDIPMRDGINLKATLLIKDDSEPHYVLLQRTPYARETSIYFINALELAYNGWAVVIQSVRGREGSEGEFSPFIQETSDGLDTINWISKQLWCNGKIAMSGASYVGFTQWCCAYSRTKALGAINPQITASNILDEWFYENGAFRNSFAQSWATGFAHTNTYSTRQANKAIKYAKALEKIYSYPKEHSPVRKIFPPFSDWANKENRLFWDKIPKLTKLNIPQINTIHLTGWYDIFCEGALKDFSFINNDTDNNKTHRMIIGPWCHNTLLNNKVGEINFGYEADGFTSKIMNEIHHWLLNSLKGLPVKGGAKVFIMGENKWEEYISWPPTITNIKKLYLNRDRVNNIDHIQTLTEEYPTSLCISHLETYNSLLPVHKGGRILDPTSHAGPYNHFGVLGKTTAETIFISKVLEKLLKVVGELELKIYLYPIKSTIDLSVTVLDVHPDGSVFNVLNSTHRIEPVKENKQEYLLTLGNIAYLFRVGHKIALRITTSNHPHLDKLDYKLSGIENVSLMFGEKYDSHLKLPCQTMSAN